MVIHSFSSVLLTVLWLYTLHLIWKNFHEKIYWFVLCFTHKHLVKKVLNLSYNLTFLLFALCVSLPQFSFAIDTSAHIRVMLHSAAPRQIGSAVGWTMVPQSAERVQHRCRQQQQRLLSSVSEPWPAREPYNSYQGHKIKLLPLIAEISFELYICIHNFKTLNRKTLPCAGRKVEVPPTEPLTFHQPIWVLGRLLSTTSFADLLRHREKHCNNPCIIPVWNQLDFRAVTYCWMTAS